VAVLAESFERPADFELDDYWRAWTTSVEQGNERFAIVLDVARGTLERVSRYFETQVLADEAEANQRVRIRIVFPGRDFALYELLMLGDEIELIEPLELRDELVARAQSIVERYR